MLESMIFAGIGYIIGSIMGLLLISKKEYKSKEFIRKMDLFLSFVKIIIIYLYKINNYYKFLFNFAILYSKYKESCDVMFDK